MATFQFDLVSPERLLFSGQVDQVDIPGTEGDFGVLAGHAPVIAAIRPGIMTVFSGGNQEKISAVAARFGYGNAAQFSKDYRQMFGVSPSEASSRTIPPSESSNIS